MKKLSKTCKTDVKVPVNLIKDIVQHKYVNTYANCECKYTCKKDEHEKIYNMLDLVVDIRIQ